MAKTKKTPKTKIVRSVVPYALFMDIVEEAEMNNRTVSSLIRTILISYRKGTELENF